MRSLSDAEIRDKINQLIKEKGVKKAKLQKEVDSLMDKMEEQYGIKYIGLHGDKSVYRKLDKSYRVKFNAQDIALIAEALDVDTDYLLTDTDVKRKEIHNVASYLGLSEKAIRRILAMREPNKNVLDDMLIADIDIDKGDVNLETVLDVSECVKNSSNGYNKSDRLGLDWWNSLNFAADCKVDRQNSLAQVAFLFRDFLKAVYPIRR